MNGESARSPSPASGASPVHSSPTVAPPEDADLALSRTLGIHVDADALRRARRLLAAHPAIDAHCHPGRFFMRGAQMWDPSVAFFAAEDGAFARALDDMRAGGLAAGGFALVSDMRSLVLTPQGGLSAARPLAPGELVEDTRRQQREFDVVRTTDGVVQVRDAAQLRAAHASGKVGALLTIEGGDFLEGRLDRLDEARTRGVASITLCHYRPNEIGDVQTEAPVHGGLSAFGRELVREMNAAGMVVDLAHASFDTVRDTAAIARAPLVISHSHLQPAEVAHPRLLSPEHARVVAAGGGVVGVWPAGIVQRNLGDYANEILRLVDVVGVEHVGIGTDMDANYLPSFDNYRQLPLVLALLAQRGMADDELVAVMGGNFLRVLQACADASTG